LCYFFWSFCRHIYFFWYFGLIYFWVFVLSFVASSVLSFWNSTPLLALEAFFFFQVFKETFLAISALRISLFLTWFFVLRGSFQLFKGSSLFIVFEFLFLLYWYFLYGTHIFLLEFYVIFILGGFGLVVYLFARDGSTPTSQQHEDLPWELYEILLCICYGQVAKVTTDTDSKWQRAFIHEFLGFLASGSWGYLISFFFPLFIFCFCVSFSFWLCLYFSIFLQHPQEGKLLKSHGSLGIWVNSILW